MARDLGWFFLNIRKFKSVDYNGADGSSFTIYSDGSGSYYGADGSSGSLYSDGSGSYYGADGSSGSLYSDGSGSYQGADGSSGTLYSDGSGSYQGADGSSGTLYSDGSGSYQGADGSSGTMYSDGSGSYHGADGSQCTINSDGSAYYYKANGISLYKNSYSKRKKTKRNVGVGEAAGIILESIAKSNSSSSSSFDASEIYSEFHRPPSLLDRILDSIRGFFVKLFKIVFCIVLIAIIGYIAINYFKNSKPITAGISSSECIGMNKDDVKERFINAGFKRVYDEELEDLILKDISKENAVGKVSIGDSAEFSSTDEFSRWSSVYVYYHSLKKVKVPITSKEAKDKNYQDIEKMFKNSRFGNITLTPKEDLKFGIFTKDGAVESVTIDGDSKYSEDATYRLDADIEIVYHTFPKKS